MVKSERTLKKSLHARAIIVSFCKPVEQRT